MTGPRRAACASNRTGEAEGHAFSNEATGGRSCRRRTGMSRAPHTWLAVRHYVPPGSPIHTRLRGNARATITWSVNRLELRVLRRLILPPRYNGKASRIDHTFKMKAEGAI
jgi:hypothetical protein